MARRGREHDSRGLDLCDHVGEILLLGNVQGFVGSSVLDVHVVLSLWLRRLEGASQNAKLGIVDLLRHLRVREVFIQDDAMNELRVFQLSAWFANNFDHVKVHVLALQIGNGQNSINGDLGLVGGLLVQEPHT